MAPPLSSHPHTEENRELCREMHIYFIYLKDLLMLRPKKIITTLRFDPEQRALTQEFIFLKSHLSLFEIWQAVQESSVLLLPFYFCLWVYVLWVLSNTGAMQASHFCLWNKIQHRSGAAGNSALPQSCCGSAPGVQTIPCLQGICH